MVNIGILYNLNLSGRFFQDGYDGVYFPGNFDYMHVGTFTGGASTFHIKASWELISMMDFLNYTPADTVYLDFVVTETGSFYTKIPNATITISNAQYAITNETGYANIPLSPSSSNYTYTVAADGYTTFEGNLGGQGLIDGTIYVELDVYTGETDYYITVSPAWIPSDGTQYLYGQIHKQGVGYTNLTDIKSLSWTYHKIGTSGNPDGLETPYLETANPDNLVTYLKDLTTSIYWGFIEADFGYTNEKTAELPNPVSLNPIGVSGPILTTATFTDIFGNDYSLSAAAIIGDNTTTNNVHVTIQDAWTGGNIASSFLAFRNEATGIWWNSTLPTGETDFTIAVGSHVSIFASADGYISQSKNITIEANMEETINMWVDGVEGESGKTDLYVLAHSYPTSTLSSQPLENVFITVTQVNQSSVETGYTLPTGLKAFVVNTSTVYSILGTKTNYISATKIINTAEINPYQVDLFLESIFVSSPVPTQPTPWTTPTISPVITPASWVEGNATVCGEPRNEASIIDYFLSQAACNGFKSAISQSLLLASIIILICMAIGGKYGKSLGAGLGAIIGFVLSFALGIIPFMLVALIIVMLILVGSILLAFKSG